MMISCRILHAAANAGGKEFERGTHAFEERQGLRFWAPTFGRVRRQLLSLRDPVSRMRPRSGSGEGGVADSPAAAAGGMDQARDCPRTSGRTFMDLYQSREAA